MDYKISKNNIKILDSYQIEKKYFDSNLDDIAKYISDNSIDCDVLVNRSRCSLKLEWTTHNFLYNLNIKRSSTKDVDLNWPQKWYESVGYFLCGCIGWIFIK